MSEQQGVPAQSPGPARQAEGTAKKGGRALVLSGGGIKGAYQAGAIVEVIERGFLPTAIYGISVGSINGGMLASYVGEQILARKSSDRSLPITKAELLAAARRVETYWHDSITDFKKLGHQRNKLVLLWEVLIGNFNGMISVDGAIEIIKKEIRPENLRAASKAGLNFFAGTLNLTAGLYVDAEAIEPEIVEYVIASGMQPIVMPMRVIRGSSKSLWQRTREIWASKKPGYVDPEDRWLDGGLHNVAPIGAAINKEYDGIVCIACRPDTLGRGSFQGRLTALGERISDVVAQRLLDTDIAQALEINKWVDLLQAEGAKSKVDEDFLKRFKRIQLKLIRPADELDVDLRTFTPQDIEKMIETGHRDAAAEMQAPERKQEGRKKLGNRAPSTKPSLEEAAARWR
jgi:NTE family protein